MGLDRGDDLIAPGKLAAGLVIGPRQAAVGIGRIGAAARLEDELIHARQFAQDEIEVMDDLDDALQRVLGLIGMKFGEIGAHGHGLAEAGVVFHGAGAEQADAHHAEGFLREMQVMALDFRFGEFG